MRKSEDLIKIESLKIGEYLVYPMSEYIRITRMMANYHTRRRSVGALLPLEIEFTISQKEEGEGFFRITRI